MHEPEVFMPLTAIRSTLPLVFHRMILRRTSGIGGAILLFSLAACGGGGGYGGSSYVAPPPTFQVTKLVADQALAGATTTDVNLVNPWGLAYGPTTDFWLANQGTATTTAYDGLGHMPTVPILVSDPTISGSAEGGPTGAVFNGTATNFLGDEFIFASLDGSISGWSTGVSTTRRVDHSGSHAVYTGLTLGINGTTTQLFAANLMAGTVDVFDTAYAPVSLGSGAFVDPTLPANYAPYNVQVLAGKLYVTYAQHAAGALRETPGAGLGYVSQFNLDGTFVKRIASAGLLNAPWGLAIAPPAFGTYGGTLLVGNFGDGHITVFDLATATAMGQIPDATGSPLTIPGLWGLAFGNGASAGVSTQLYVTAGTLGENRGLFATISYGSPAGTGGGGYGGGTGY